MTVAEPVGRERELAALRLAIEDVATGGKRLIGLIGEPGVGKSTLLNWSIALSRQAGFRCSITRVPSMGAVAPMFPLGEILQQLEADTVDSSLKPDGIHSDADEGTSTDVLSVVRTIQCLADAMPIAIFVDDLQWAPHEGLTLLYAALRLVDAPVLCVLTIRSGDAPGPLPVGSSDLNVEYMVVPGLDPESISEVARLQLEGPIVPSLSRVLFERTLGNPLFAMELLRYWKESHAIAALPGGYWGLSQIQSAAESRSLLEMISARLKSLEQDAFQCAAALAALGRGGRPEDIRSIIGASYSHVVQLLTRLEGAGIAKRDASTGRYSLSHPMFQAALIQGLTETQKAALHGRIFLTLRDGSEVPAAEIAFHAVRALERPADLTRCLSEAAVEAEQMGAHAQAASWYEQLEKASNDPATISVSLIGRAAAAEHFDPGLAIEIYSRALEEVATSLPRASVLIGRARAWRMAGLPRRALDDLAEAARFADEMEGLEIRDAGAVIHAVLGEGDVATAQFQSLATETEGTAIHARVLGHLATSEYFRGRLRGAAPLFERALRYTVDVPTRQYLQMNLSWILTLMGEWNNARGLLDEGMEEAKNANDRWFLVPLMTSATVLAVWQGELDKALDLGTQALRLTDETYLMDRLGAMGALGLVLLEKGLIAEAAELLASAPLMVEASSEKNEVQMSLLILGQCLLSLGDLRGCQGVIAQLKSTLPFNLSWTAASLGLEARFFLAENRPSDALARLAPFLSKPAEAPIQQAEVLAIAADALMNIGRHKEALNAVSRAREIYLALGSPVRVYASEQWLESHAVRRRGRPRERVISDLTKREVQVLTRIVKGSTNAEIARDLFISSGTVKKHVENIRLKLGASRRSELIALGLRVLTGLPLELTVTGSV